MAQSRQHSIETVPIFDWLGRLQCFSYSNSLKAMMRISVFHIYCLILQSLSTSIELQLQLQCKYVLTKLKLWTCLRLKMRGWPRPKAIHVQVSGCSYGSRETVTSSRAQSPLIKAKA
jgi:hypothetical protein